MSFMKGPKNILKQAWTVICFKEFVFVIKNANGSGADLLLTIHNIIILNHN